MRVEREIEVAAPPEAAFAAIADWTSHSEWQPTLLKVEAVEPLGPEAKLVEHREGFGQRITFDLHVKHWAPPERVLVHAKSRSRIALAADEEFVVEPRGTGSLIRMALEFDVPLVLKPLAHGVGIEAGKQLEASLEALRDRVAATAGRAASS